jgi:hypothetical protein
VALGAIVVALSASGGVFTALIETLRDWLNRTYLRTASPESIPGPDRELVISRSLPYAVVLGDTDHWLRMVGTSTPHWYEGTPTTIPRLITALSERLR